MPLTSSPHEYIPAQDGYGRSPCPALNALANHGYLPRDGKNISVPQLVKALTSIYNISYPLAFALASMGVVLCGHGVKLDLEGLRKHDAIEHDASMFHRDLAETGGPLPSNKPDPKLLQAVLDLSNGNKITMENLIRHKYNREVQVGLPQKKMGIFLRFLSHGEVVLCHHALHGADDAIAVERFKAWVGEERLPEDLAPPNLGFVKMHIRDGEVMKQVHDMHVERAKNRRDQ